MNIKELKKALKAAGIPTEHYNLDGKGRNDERLCLVKEDSKWVVYYLEREFGRLSCFLTARKRRAITSSSHFDKREMLT